MSIYVRERLISQNKPCVVEQLGWVCSGAKQLGAHLVNELPEDQIGVGNPGPLILHVVEPVLLGTVQVFVHPRV